MSLIDPIIPFLGPLGKILSTNSNDILTVGLGLLALVCLGLYTVKKSVFETSKAWVGATVVLSFLTCYSEEWAPTVAALGTRTPILAIFSNLSQSLTCS